MGASVPGNRLLPVCKSIEAFVAKFFSHSGVQWETRLNEISHTQQQQTSQLEQLTKALDKADEQLTPTNSTTNSEGGARVRSWAQVAATADPPPATKTIKS